MYALGRGDLGQLGVGDDSDHPTPVPVAALAGKDIVHIAAGEYHTAFLTGTILFCLFSAMMMQLALRSWRWWGIASKMSAISGIFRHVYLT